MARRLFLLLFLFIGIKAIGAPVIGSFSPASGPVGSLIQIAGNNLGNITAASIGNVPAIIIANTDTRLTLMVMPGSATAAIKLVTAGGTAVSSSNFMITETPYPYVQQGDKLVGSPLGDYPLTETSTGQQQGLDVAISADGNTMVSCSPYDYPNGAVYVFTRNSGVWKQEAKIIESPGKEFKIYLGTGAALSADGNTLLISAYNGFPAGPAYLYTRSNTVWTRQALLTPSDENISYGSSNVALSADGNTAIITGMKAGSPAGSAWVFTRTGSTWTQIGTITAPGGAVNFDTINLSLSADGNTLLLARHNANDFAGIVEAFSRNGNSWTSQGILTGTGAKGHAGQGNALALSADGNMAVIGGDGANGAAWIFKRNNNIWAQQGNKLSPKPIESFPLDTNNYSSFGQAVGITADGSTVLVACGSDVTVGNSSSSTWVYKQTGGEWVQQSRQFFAKSASYTTYTAIALSADGSAMALGVPKEDGPGRVYMFAPPTEVFVGSIYPRTAIAGTIVNISGFNFNGVTAVNFSGTPAQSFTINSSTSITAVVAANTGNYSLVEVKSGQQTSLLTGFHFVPVPEINLLAYANTGDAMLRATPLADATYQWYKDGVLIPGATNIIYNTQQRAVYTVSISLDGLTQTSQPFSFIPNYVLPANTFTVAVTDATCKGSNNGAISISTVKTLDYTATITGAGITKALPFTTQAAINNLAPGTYHLCITIAGQSTFQQCYDLTVTEPKDLSVYSTVNHTDRTVTLSLNGATRYNIKLNGTTYSTANSSITLPLQAGNNNLTVTTDKLCQGAVQSLISVSDKIAPYPIPFQNILYFNAGDQINHTVSVKLYNVTNGALVYTNEYVNKSGILQLDLVTLKAGVYTLHVYMDNTEKVFKVIKK